MLLNVIDKTQDHIYPYLALCFSFFLMFQDSSIPLCFKSFFLTLILDRYARYILSWFSSWIRFYFRVVLFISFSLKSIFIHCIWGSAWVIDKGIDSSGKKKFCRQKWNPRCIGYFCCVYRHFRKDWNIGPVKQQYKTKFHVYSWGLGYCRNLEIILVVNQGLRKGS